MNLKVIELNLELHFMEILLLIGLVVVNEWNTTPLIMVNVKEPKEKQEIFSCKEMKYSSH